MEVRIFLMATTIQAWPWQLKKGRPCEEADFVTEKQVDWPCNCPLSKLTKLNMPTLSVTKPGLFSATKNRATTGGEKKKQMEFNS